MRAHGVAGRVLVGRHDDGDAGQRQASATSSMAICDGPSSPMLMPAWVPTTLTLRCGKATDMRS